MDAGACGYVMKNIRRGELADAIRAAHRGESPAQQTVSTSRQTTSERRGLSHRELEVLGLVRQGFTNAEIGRLIGISERTTRWQVAAIMEKLGAADRAQAVARGFETGLLGVTGGGTSG